MSTSLCKPAQPNSSFPVLFQAESAIYRGGHLQTAPNVGFASFPSHQFKEVTISYLFVNFVQLSDTVYLHPKNASSSSLLSIPVIPLRRCHPESTKQSPRHLCTLHQTASPCRPEASENRFHPLPSTSAADDGRTVWPQSAPRLWTRLRERPPSNY